MASDNLLIKSNRCTPIDTLKPRGRLQKTVRGIRVLFIRVQDSLDQIDDGGTVAC
jgi:hypothetical protein